MVCGIANARYLKARLDINGGINGLIVFPDSYEHPSSVTITYPDHINKGKYPFTDNVFSSDDWSSMESAGAVFLPAAGCRDISNGKVQIQNVGTQCYYWSASHRPFKEGADYKAQAKNLRSADGGTNGPDMYADSDCKRSRGNCVRLVCPAFEIPPSN